MVDKLNELRGEGSSGKAIAEKLSDIFDTEFTAQMVKDKLSNEKRKAAGRP